MKEIDHRQTFNHTQAASDHWLEQAMDLTTLFELPAYVQEAQRTALADYQNLAWPSIERVDYQSWPLIQTQFTSAEATQQLLTYGVQAAIGGYDADKDAVNEQSADDKQSDEFGQTKQAQTKQSKTQASDPDLIQIVHAGNHTIYSSVPLHLQAQGVIVADLFEAMNEYPDLVEAHLYSVVPALADKITAYQTAYLNGGVFIYIPDHCQPKITVDALLLQDSRFNQAYNKRVLIVAGANSRLDYVERLQTEGSQANTATITAEVIAGPGAKVSYCGVDNFNKNTTAYIKRYGQLANDATINWALAAMNDGHTILDTDTYLNGQGSQSQLAIVAIATGDQIQGIDAKVVNRGQHSVAHILQHGVIQGQATLTFNGIGLIEKHAKHADAQQESRLMMLSDQARGDANPILLIEEFEVTAGHAASVGQLDQQQLYYLMSRGLRRQEAEHLVVRGFLGSVLRAVESPTLRDQLVAIIDHKLTQ